MYPDLSHPVHLLIRHLYADGALWPQLGSFSQQRSRPVTHRDPVPRGPAAGVARMHTVVESLYHPPSSTDEWLQRLSTCSLHGPRSAVLHLRPDGLGNVGIQIRL